MRDIRGIIIKERSLKRSWGRNRSKLTPRRTPCNILLSLIMHAKNYQDTVVVHQTLTLKEVPQQGNLKTAKENIS